VARAEALHAGGRRGATGCTRGGAPCKRGCTGFSGDRPGGDEWIAPIVARHSHRRDQSSPKKVPKIRVRLPHTETTPGDFGPPCTRLYVDTLSGILVPETPYV